MNVPTFPADRPIVASATLAHRRPFRQVRNPAPAIRIGGDNLLDAGIDGACLWIVELRNSRGRVIERYSVTARAAALFCGQQPTRPWGRIRLVSDQPMAGRSTGVEPATMLNPGATHHGSRLKKTGALSRAAAFYVAPEDKDTDE